MAKLAASIVVVVAFLFCLSALPSAHADIPVHCLYHQVVGKWVFNLGANTFTNKIDCSAEFNVEGLYVVDLQQPDIAIDADGNRGFWTMIYDEGFEVVIGKHKFFAFNRYVENGNTSTSYCDQTLPGWYHEDSGVPGNEKNWGCFYGVKSNVLTKAASLTRSKFNFRRILESPKSLEGVTYTNDYAMIEEINRAQSLWRAAPAPELEGMPLESVLQRAGSRVSVIKQLFESASRASTHSSTPLVSSKISADELRETVKERRLHHSSSLHHSSVSQLPDSFDWRNVDGVNYVSPVRNQQKCGSCYAFAATALLEARTRILSKNEDQAIFAPQDVVSCSEYSQGCDGGFEYLVGKFGQDFGIVEEECFPYQGTEVSCSQKCSDETKVRYATDYHFVGGFYGACSQELMQQEIYAHGPVTVEFMVYPDFMHYAGGIYKHVPSAIDMAINPWEEVNHAVLVVGWGVENGTNYWIVKNSWSTTWGEEGYFRILRGADEPGGECAIESMAVAITPILPSL